MKIKTLHVWFSDEREKYFTVASFDNANYHEEMDDAYRFQMPNGYLIIPKFNITYFEILNQDEFKST